MRMLFPSLGPLRVKLRTIEGWSKEIRCNIGFKKGCPLSTTLFGIYIDKVEECLEAIRCDGTRLIGMVITLLLYADDIILYLGENDDDNKKPTILQDYYSKMGMIVNTDKTEAMIIKSKNIIYDNN